MVQKLYKHTEPLRGFPSFCQTPFLPNIIESKNGLQVSDDFCRTPETAPSNLRGSIEPSLRTTVLVSSHHGELVSYLLPDQLKRKNDRQHMFTQCSSLQI